MTGCTVATVCVLALLGSVQTIGSGPASVTLEPAEEGYAVIYRNTIVSSLTIEPWELEYEGFTVRGQIASQNGDLPDDLQVLPPPGWACDPCAVTVQEGESGVVLLWPMGLS